VSNPHRARKRFGQNFLTDRHIIDRIVDAVAPGEHEKLVEIGPGKGALTQVLLSRCQHLISIELDRDLVSLLEQRRDAWTGPGSTFEIISADALKFDFRELALQAGEPLRIVGNLPYNISSPLLFRLLDVAPHIADMHFMLQREVVDRLTAGPGSKRYGRLGVMVQWQCRTQALFNVPPTAFSPQPKVESAIVRLVPHQLDARQKQRQQQLLPVMLETVSAAFSQRRKTLRNSLSNVLSSDQLVSIGVDPGARAEVISIEDYERIANSVAQTRS